MATDSDKEIEKMDSPTDSEPSVHRYQSHASAGLDEDPKGESQEEENATALSKSTDDELVTEATNEDY